MTSTSVSHLILLGLGPLFACFLGGLALAFQRMVREHPREAGDLYVFRARYGYDFVMCLNYASHILIVRHPNR